MREGKYLVILVLILLNTWFIKAGFSVAEDLSSDDFEIIDIAGLLGLSSVNITGIGIDYSEISSGKSGELEAQLTFAKESASVDINGTIFLNIVPQGISNHPTYLLLNKDGNLIKADFTVNENGSFYIFNNTRIYAPPNSRVLFNSGEVEIQLVNGAELKELPGLLNPDIFGSLIKIKGENVILPKGIIMNGALNYRDGNIFINPNEDLFLNNVELIVRNLDTRLFLNGEEGTDEGDWISFDFDNKKLVIFNSLKKPLRENPIISFNEGNPFIQIDKGDHLAIQPVFSPSSKTNMTKIEIQNREAFGLIPSITAEGDFEIEEDSKTLVVGRDSIYLSILPDISYWRYYFFKDTKEDIPITSTTSPIELVISKTGNRIFIDNFNRIALNVIGESEDIFSLSEGVATKFSSRVKYNYITEEDAEKLIGKEIVFLGDIPEGSRDFIAGRLRDYYDSLNQETRDSLTKIKFLSQEEFDKFRMTVGATLGARAFAYPGGVIVFPSDDYRFDLQTFLHESAHERHSALESKGDSEKIRKNTERYLSLMMQIKELEEKIKESSSLPEKASIDFKILRLRDELSLLQDKLSEDTRILYPFRIEWFLASGDSFIKKCVEGEIGLTYIDDAEDDSGSKHGFVKPYGCLNFYEDVATFVEVTNDPSFFKDLINPGSPKYDARYRKKLGLLYKYKFISNEKYNEILEVAGVR